MYYFQVCCLPTLMYIYPIILFCCSPNTVAMRFRKVFFHIVLNCCFVINNASVLLTSSNAAAAASDPLFLNNSAKVVVNNSSGYDTSTTVTGDYTSAPIVCDLNHYGPLVPESCAEALTRLKAIGPADEVFTWADQGYGLRSGIQLPYRISSCELT